MSRGPRPVQDDSGALMLGDAILDDWRKRTQTGVARVRCYYDVLPDKASEITLDSTRRRMRGAIPLPKLSFKDAPESVELRSVTEDSIKRLMQDLAKAGKGQLLRTSVDNFQDHPAGGCRMGKTGADSVTDAWGRTHDHENLFIAGRRPSVTGSCANATLTFCALSLRTAAAMAKA